jgi:hypothetical protein
VNRTAIDTRTRGVNVSILGPDGRDGRPPTFDSSSGHLTTKTVRSYRTGSY